MEIKIKYFSLLFDKKMGYREMFDCEMILPKGQELILIKKDEDGMYLFETDWGGDVKAFIWTKENEVCFLKEIQENWSEEKINKRNGYINGKFI